MAVLGNIVEITRFVNPHLFWLIKSDDVNKRSELEKELKNISTFSSVKNLRVGQYVLIKDGEWKRAIARDVNPEGVTYWLIDYGILLEYPHMVFNLPEEFTRVEPIAKQAALKDVVCVKQICGALDLKTEHIPRFTVGALKCFNEHLQEATAISFSCLEQKQNIHVGELYLKNSNQIWYNVAQILASQEIVAFDEQLFNAALVENTKAETAFMQSSTANARELQHLLDHLEQYPPQGRGRGVAPKLHFPATIKKEDVLENSVQFQKFDESTASQTASNVHAPGTSKEEQIFDNSESMKPKSAGHKGASKRLRELKAKTSSANVNQSSELDCSADSGSQLNLSNTSENSDGSSKGAYKKMLKSSGNSKSVETSECSFSTAKSCLSESDQSTEKTSKIRAYKRMRELNAKLREGGEQSASEPSIESTSQSEETDLFGSSSVSGASCKSSFFDSDRRKCNFGKGVCDCENCFSWRANPLYYSDQRGFVDEHKKKASTKPIEKPSLLLKSSEEKLDSKLIKSYTTIMKSKSKVEIAYIPKILVHGLSFPQPVPSIASVPFHPEIQAHMRKYEKMFDIQSYVWPSLMRSMNVCMITPANRGKTVAYMPAVLSYLLEKDSRYVNLPKKSTGPLVIILCSSIQIAEEVEAVAADMLRNIRKKPVCTLAVPPIDHILQDQFKTRCDLLVTTPTMLVSLLNSKVIDIQRLCHLVIENCDIILDTYFENLNIILNVIQAMLTKRMCNNSVQLITTAECWTPALENLIKQIESVPIVYIGSFLEAALYGRAQLQLSFVASKQKVMSLIDILDQNWKTKRSVVLFNENSEIDEVKEHLQVQGIETLCIYDYTAKIDIVEMEARWSLDSAEGNKHMVLLCTDQIFTNTLNITNAAVLVHYSLPDRWNKFISRFGCLIESYQSPLTENKAIASVRSEVHIFIDEDCNEQFSRLLQLLVRMGVKLSDKYCDFYKKLTNKREQDNIQSGVALCSKLILFGECPAHIRDPSALSHQKATRSFTSRNCCNRHMLSKNLDKPDELPNSGTINYKILRVKNVNCITVKIVEWTDTEGKRHVIENFDNLDTKLKEALQEQKILVGHVIVNNSYVYVTEAHQTCSRCVVLKVTKIENITKRPSMALVRFLDTGVEWNVATVDLYEMPIEFKLIPSQSVDLYIANMIPPHLDDSWSKYCLNRVAKLLRNENYDSESVYGISRIFLRLGDVFWVDNVLVKENLTTTNLAVTRLNLRKALLDANLTARSENQLTKLYKLCEEAGISLPDYNLAPLENHVVVPSLQQATPQWAHLDPDNDCISVYLVLVESPDLFYVRLQKFDSLFMCLQKDIQKAIAKPGYKSEFDVKVNNFYLAKDPGGDEFGRVQVKCIDGDNVTCYYVDFGDFSIVKKSELKFLPDYFITKLPFQAIECRLYGLLPVLDTWQDQAINIMENYIFEPGTDFFRTLYCNICTTDTSINTEGRKYSVILVDYFKKQVIFINQQLIYHGEAVSLEGETLDLNFTTFSEKQEELSEEEHDQVPEENYDNLQETQEESSYDDEPIFDFHIIKPELFISEVTHVNIPPPRAIAANSKPELPPMVALPTPDYSTPNVLWYQTNTHIKLSIELIGVEYYNLRVIRQKFLSFKTSFNDKKYQLDLQLFDKVLENVQTSNCGLQLRLTLEKCVPCSWPRLLHSTKSMKFIKYDYSKCEIEDDDENKKILDFGSDFEDNLSDGNPFYYESGCDEEDVSDADSLC